MSENKKGKKIMKSMQKQYGKKKGEEVFYASLNKKKIKVFKEIGYKTYEDKVYINKEGADRIYIGSEKVNGKKEIVIRKKGKYQSDIEQLDEIMRSGYTSAAGEALRERRRILRVHLSTCCRRRPANDHLPTRSGTSPDRHRTGYSVCEENSPTSDRARHSHRVEPGLQIRFDYR